MGKNTEIELKLAVTNPDVWEKLLAAPLLHKGLSQRPSRKVFEAVYFDTNDQALEKAHLAYRIRREGSCWIATVKGGGTSAGGLHQRQEWNVAVEGPEPCIEKFNDVPVGPALREAVGEKELLPLLSTNFERTIFNITAEDGSLIEVAADKGEVVAGTDKNLRSPILEIELELKNGSPSALLKLGAQLACEFPLLPETRSKYFRGLVLNGLVSDAGTPEPKPKVSGLQAGEGLEISLVHLIHQVVIAQDAFLRQPDVPETIHNLRIEIRRLRSLLALARPLAPDGKEYRRFETALRDWAQELGPVREHDVLGENWARVAANCLGKHDDDRLTPLLAGSRNKEVAALKGKLGTGRSTALLLDLWGWLKDKPLSNAPESKYSLELFASMRVRQWLKSILKAGKKPDLFDRNQVHDIRVKGKKLCYTLEYFNFLFGGTTGDLLEKISAWQNELGYLHDIFYTDGFLRKLLAGQLDPEIHRQAGFLAGWQKREMDVLQRRIPECFKLLRKAARQSI